jgi:protein TonB
VGATEVRVAQRALNLKRVRYSAPQYPSIALQERLSGFVTIEFVVDTKGQPVGLRIIDAQPARVFERSVLMAAKRWRYTPLVVDNVPRERPIRMIIRFETTS